MTERSTGASVTTSPLGTGARGGDGSSEAGSIVLGWLTRLFVTFAVLSIIGFDAISIGVARVNAIDEGTHAAEAAAAQWQQSHDLVRAFAEAQNAAGTDDEVLTQGFAISPDGTVHLRMRKTARTLVVFRFEPIARWAVVNVATTGQSIGT